MPPTDIRPGFHVTRRPAGSRPIGALGMTAPGGVVAPPPGLAVPPEELAVVPPVLPEELVVVPPVLPEELVVAPPVLPEELVAPPLLSQGLVLVLAAPG